MKNLYSAKHNQHFAGLQTLIVFTLFATQSIASTAAPDESQAIPGCLTCTEAKSDDTQSHVPLPETSIRPSPGSFTERSFEGDPLPPLFREFSFPTF